jgi:hypothetical protein
MNKKNLIISIIFIALAGIAWFLIKKENVNPSAKYPDRDFAVQDTQQIYKIFLADREGETILLERQKKGWLLNGKYEAFDHTVNMLLSTIAELRVKYIPPRVAVPNLVNDIASNGIKVELYDKTNSKMKTFYVGGNTSDDLGTPFIMEGYEQPYVMHLAALEGGLRSRFRIREKQLISRWIFREDPDNIAEISINYLTQRNKSFVLTLDKKNPEIKPYYPITQPIQAKLFPPAVESYIYHFKKLGAEAIIQDQVEIDSIMKLIPFCEITLKNKDGEITDLKLWPIHDMIEEQSSKFNNPQTEWFVERYYAYSETKGLFYLIQHHVFGSILWSYDSFFDHSTLEQKKMN